MERFYKNVFIMFKKIMVCILLLFICLPVNVLRADAKITPRSDEYGNPIVTSVKSNAWGKTLQAGDTIHFSVTLDEEYDGQELELDLRSTKDSVSDMEVELDYVEDTKSYDGDFTIPQETYASEWYVMFV